jgi:hypothetical protein
MYQNKILKHSLFSPGLLIHRMPEMMTNSAKVFKVCEYYVTDTVITVITAFIAVSPLSQRL